MSFFFFVGVIVCLTDWILVVRTPKSLIIVSEYPNKHININLQPYKTKEEVLKDIDVDCLAGTPSS